MRTLVVIILLLMAAHVAFAQGTPHENAACHHDVLRLCKAELSQGVFAIGNCLSRNKMHLSRECRKVITSHGL